MEGSINYGSESMSSDNKKHRCYSLAMGSTCWRFIYIYNQQQPNNNNNNKRSNISAKLPTLTLPSDTSFNTMRPKWNISLALFLYCLGGQVLAWQKCPFRGGKTLLFFSFFVNTKWVFFLFFLQLLSKMTVLQLSYICLGYLKYRYRIC